MLTFQIDARSFVITALLTFATSLSAGEVCEPVGSPLTDRPNVDGAVGSVVIYRGGAMAGPATPDDWSFFDDDSAGDYVTPILFRVEGGSFVIVALGTSRASDATGVQTHPFGFSAGDPTLEAGSVYTLGFTTRRLQAGSSPESFSTVGLSTGVIDFTAPGSQNDPWDYALPTEIQLGQEYGPLFGQVPVNPFGTGGRTFSAQLNFECPCPADLAPPTGTLNFFDVSAFLGAYNTQNDLADFAAPFGTFNFFDVSAFLAAYNAGC